MASLNLINPKADLARAKFALQINYQGARGLQDVLSSNLGPRGTMKMLVSGAGDIKITKDGMVLLSEMQIQHPTAALISKVSSAQDDVYGDGTTSTVLLVGELLHQAELLINEGMHPRLISTGYNMARDKCLEVLEQIKRPVCCERETLLSVAKTSLGTKLRGEIVKIVSEAIVDAILCVKIDDSVDLHMIEVMEMLHKSDADTRLIKGLVLDHGGRHPQMPKHVRNAYILTCNVSLEYEKTEINSGYFYKTTEEKQKMVEGERKYVNAKVQKIIDIKKRLCDGTDKGFVVINQKGIDPISLALLSQEGILALRRAKRRNMERMVLACGGQALNSLEDIQPEHLGFAGSVLEYTLGDEKYTFVEDVPKARSVTILINGPTKHSLSQIKDAVRDGLRAVNNTINDCSFIPGGGAAEVVMREELMVYSKTISSKEQLGIVAFANSLMVIPRTLSKNAGLDPQDVLVKLTSEYNNTKIPAGVDLSTGEAIEPFASGIVDNFCVKKQIITGCSSIASNLLLVDEIFRAGISTMKRGENE